MKTYCPIVILATIFVTLLASSCEQMKQGGSNHPAETYHLSRLDTRLNDISGQLEDLQGRISQLSKLLQQQEELQKKLLAATTNPPMQRGREASRTVPVKIERSAPLSDTFELARVEHRGTPKTTAAKPSQTHTIAQGDTFSELAKRYGVSLKSLMQANPTIKATRMRIGQKISIPGRQNASASNSSTSRVAGKHQKEAVRNYGTNEQSIKKLSEIVPLPEYKRLVRLKSKRPVREIAEHFKTDVATLNRLNRTKHSEEDIVLAGEVLYVPSPTPAS